MEHIKKLIGCVLIAVVMLLSTTGTAWAADPVGFEKWPFQTFYDVNKVLKIRFNMPIDPVSITKENIYILSDAGSSVATKLTVSSDGLYVFASPVKAYDVGKDYCLYITNRVKSKNGVFLKIPVIVPFTIVDKNVEIQHISCNYSSFFTVFTVITSPEVYKVKIGTTGEMHFQGNNMFVLGVTDLKQGATVTIRAYNEDDKLIETKKYTVR